MEEGKNGAVFVKPERTAREAESRAVMNQSRRLPRGLQGLLKKRKVTDRANRREKIAAERSTARPALPRCFSRAEVIVDFKPPADIQLTLVRFRQLRSRPAKYRFEQPRFLDVTVQEAGEIGRGEQVRGNERLQSERMSESANRQGAVSQMQKTQCGEGSVSGGRFFHHWNSIGFRPIGKSISEAAGFDPVSIGVIMRLAAGVMDVTVSMIV